MKRNVYVHVRSLGRSSKEVVGRNDCDDYFITVRKTTQAKGTSEQDEYGDERGRKG